MREIIIKNVQVLYGEKLELISGHGVYVKDGKIEAVLKESEIPADIPFIDGDGSYLIPGLIDLHVHMIWDGSLDPVRTSEEEGYEQMMLRAAANCRHYIEHGITTVRDLGSINDIVLHISKGIKRNLILGQM